MIYCTATGCDRPRVGYSRFCDAHRQRDKRHGHPEQRAVLKSDVKPFAEEITDWIDTQPNAGEIWASLESVWSAVITGARAEIAKKETGKSYIRWHVEACYGITRVAGDVNPREVIATILGMVAVQEIRPFIFRSDRAFLIQLSRRVMGLTESHAGRWRDYQTGRTKLVYRVPSPRSAVWLGRSLMESLGGLGITLWRRLMNDRERVARAKVAAYANIRAPEVT